jgi:hypothetical protein
MFKQPGGGSKDHPYRLGVKKADFEQLVRYLDPRSELC